MNSTTRASRATLGVVALAIASSLSVSANAQLGKPVPNQPAGELKVSPNATKALKPDLRAKIVSVDFACPVKNTDQTFVKIRVVLNNNGVVLPPGLLDAEWFVDGIRSASQLSFPASQQTEMNSAAGKAMTFDSPTLANFIASGKGDVAKLNAPKSVVVKFTLDVGNKLDETDKTNNTATFNATIPAKLCP